MSLVKYRKKRTLSKTPEPAGGKPGKNNLQFVVQKHAASHLHYDFRLEMEGVLKSWAVPKGPSMDPKIKRLAMMVEDHPFNYRTFEGTIPKGNYGAGTVMVWDEGTYESAEVKGTKSEQDKNLRHQLHKGKIKFTLHGKKLKGEFVLIKAQARGENAWLLMKLNDQFATAADITLKDKSVQSNKTIEQIGNGNAKMSRSHKPGVKTKKTPSKKTSSKKPKTRLNLEKLPTLKFPKTLQPMLTTLVDKPFNQEGWIYEVKWDGYRALAFSHKGEVELKSRNDKPFNEKFYPIHDAVKALNLEAILDGEIVVLNETGKSNFGALQNWRSEADGALLYYVFDILWLNGKSLMNLPLEQRKNILQQVIPEQHTIRISDSFEISGTEMFGIAQQSELEGIIAKKSGSLYQPGKRTSDWLKIKTHKRQEVVIGGYTRNEDTSKLFSALLVGVFQNGSLLYTGKIGTGFTDDTQRTMMQQFKSHIADRPPFKSEPDVNKPSRFRPNPPRAKVTWLKPELVCEVSFTEMTTDGIMRHPSFEGMREDKKAKEVKLELEKPAQDVVKPVKRKTNLITPVKPNERHSLLNPTEETQVKTIQGHELKFTNLSKIFWPKEKITKRDLINYYYQVAPYILPYLKDRPQSLNRHPNGIEGQSFYQKDVTGKAPDWIQTYLYHSEGDTRDKHFLVCTDEASLLYMVSLGCIEINPWSSTVHKPDYPDWCIIDLDPGKTSFNTVIEAAQVTYKMLKSAGIPSYCKTSGSTGLHIYVPLGARYTYEQSKEFARAIVTIVQKELPKTTTIERKVADRGGKIYLDFLQNRPQATLACPYAVRPKPGATVSMPLHWDEVKKTLKMQDFTIFNAVERIQSVGDLFKPVLSKEISLQKIIKTLVPD